MYINGNKVETTGTIDVTGVKTLEVKVVAEDERYSTTYTYQIVKGETYE